MKRIQSFQAFKANESLDAGTHHDNVRIFEIDQYEEFFDHVNTLKSDLGVKCFWSLQEGFWHRYLKGGNMFAVIETGDQEKGKAIIGALLDADGKVMMAYYNDDSPCTLEVAENHLGPQLLHNVGTHQDNVRIFEVDQYEEFFDHVNDLKTTLGVKCFWSLQEGFWHRYLRGGNKFAVIDTGDQNGNKAIIGALLDEEGKVMMAYYNDDSPCTLEVAKRHLDPKLFHKNESVHSDYDDQDMVCRNCGCDCDVCECNECDCGTEDSSSMDKYVESKEWTMELSPELIQAIDKGDEDSVHALLEAGADLSYRNYYPVKRAIKAAHKTKGNKRAFDVQMDILETIITELDYIGQDAVDEIMVQIEDVSSDIAVFVKNKLAEIEVMDAEPVAEKEFERFSMFERKKSSTSYAKSGLKNPKKADLDKDKKISGYEKARGKAVQKSLQAQKEEETGSKGLTAAQKKLPAGLQKAILTKKKKK